jgi:hypothetical protein
MSPFFMSIDGKISPFLVRSGAIQYYDDPAGLCQHGNSTEQLRHVWNRKLSKLRSSLSKVRPALCSAPVTIISSQGCAMIKQTPSHINDAHGPPLAAPSGGAALEEKALLRFRVCLSRQTWCHIKLRVTSILRMSYGLQALSPLFW